MLQVCLGAESPYLLLHDIEGAAERLASQVLRRWQTGVVKRLSPLHTVGQMRSSRAMPHGYAVAPSAP
ncbi:hypothetical protein [Roseateles sp. P5_E7]